MMKDKIIDGFALASILLLRAACHWRGIRRLPRESKHLAVTLVEQHPLLKENWLKWSGFRQRMKRVLENVQLQAQCDVFARVWLLDKHLQNIVASVARLHPSGGRLVARVQKEDTLREEVTAVDGPLVRRLFDIALLQMISDNTTTTRLSVSEKSEHGNDEQVAVHALLQLKTTTTTTSGTPKPLTPP